MNELYIFSSHFVLPFPLLGEGLREAFPQGNLTPPLSSINV
jgi:hypothetical protein